MGFFKKLRESIDDAQQLIKDSVMDKIEDVQQQLKDNIEGAKKEMLGCAGELLGQPKSGSDEQMLSAPQNETPQSNIMDEAKEMEEPARKIGTLENGVLEMFEGLITLDYDCLDDYKNLRKIILPGSLELIKSESISYQEQLEEIDFSKATRLKEIPEWFIEGKHSIHRFIIPNGVKKVGKCFLGDSKPGSEVYVPASVEEMSYISGNENNDLLVFLFAPDLDISDLHEDVDVLYVLPQYYSTYSKKLIDLESRARLCKMPADKLNFYGNNQEQPVGNTLEPMPQESAPQESINVKETDDHDEFNVGKMFSDRIENLISAALQDGVLTDKEEEILKRRVEKEGEDWDEVEMYIQSLLQKRQQELTKEVTLTQGAKVANDMNDEQKRAETLRKCPKCGAYIPHLSNVCPDCGFIIGKNDTDKIISTLISLLRICIDNVLISVPLRGETRIELRCDETIIKRDIYDMLPNCYKMSSDQVGMNATTIKVEYNRSGIITEANMYSENDTVNSMLFKLHKKEKDALILEIRNLKIRWDELSEKEKRKYEWRANMIRSCINTLKDYYDIMDNAEIAAFETEYESFL